MSRNRRALLLAIAMLSAAAAGCAGKRPVSQTVQRLDPRTVVVLVPGFTGSKLRDRRSGERIWGRTKNLFFPKDRGYTLAQRVPLALDGDGRLEADEVLTELRLGPVRVHIYDTLVRVMEQNGYVVGNLASPAPDRTFLLFAYDWRLGSPRAAAELARQLEELRRVRGEERLRVHLICHSTAARITRYLIKYGGVSLERAEAGAHGPPPRIDVAKLILIGTGNGGGMRGLEELNRPRRFVPLIGRRLFEETAYTMPSVYETLPVYRRDLFLDAEGRVREIDLFDPEAWRKYGWGIYGSGPQKRLSEPVAETIFADADARHAYLTQALDRARRLHELLRTDTTGFPDTRYYMIQSGDRATAERALLVQEEGEWRTYYPSSRRIRRDPALAAAGSAPGDGHATVASQMWLSPQEQAALAGPPVEVSRYHRRIVLDRLTQQEILRILADDAAP